MTSDLFNLAEGERLKAEGMARAAQAKTRQQWLEVAREYARNAARSRPDRTATMDDVSAMFGFHFLDSHELLGNAAGSVFLRSEWEFTGRRVKSIRPSRHANEIKVWRLR